MPHRPPRAHRPMMQQGRDHRRTRRSRTFSPLSPSCRTVNPPVSGWQDFLSRPAKHSRLFEVPRQPEGFALPAILSRRAASAQGVMDSERHRRVSSWNDKAPESKQQTVLPPTPPQVRPLLRRSWCRLDAQRGSWGEPRPRRRLAGPAESRNSAPHDHWRPIHPRENQDVQHEPPDS